MKKLNILTVLALMGGLLLPITSSAHNYHVTSGYQNLLQMANGLHGISFNDARYNNYCGQYAQVSVAQAYQRINQQCKQAIPTPNNNLKGRWTRSYASHRNWCAGVSAHASKAESERREGSLKNCLNRHNHQPTRAQIRRDCMANDNVHKKSAHGDIKYVRKCLNAGVSANIREGNQWTPLHSAARNGRLQVVKLLLRRGAHINVKDVTGRTPMDQAKVGRRPSTQKYLGQKGGVLTR